MRLTAAIIGLGQIGMGYDYHYPVHDNQWMLTHASALMTHPNYQLIAAIDPNQARRELFTQKYSLPTFANIQELAQAQQPDLIVIAVPTPAHFSVFQETFTWFPALKAIVCEKPLTDSLDLAKQMVAQAKEQKCVLLVNYIRRFEPGVLELKKKLAEKIIGDVYKITVTYSKGLLNNGSHYIDLLQFIFGKFTNLQLIKNNSTTFHSDPEPDFIGKIGAIDVMFMAVQDDCFFYHDMTLIGTKGIGRYQQGGELITLQIARPHAKLSKNYQLLDETITIPNEMARYQGHVYEHLHRHLTNNDPLNSTGLTSIESLKCVDTIIQRINEYEQQISII